MSTKAIFSNTIQSDGIAESRTDSCGFKLGVYFFFQYIDEETIFSNSDEFLGNFTMPKDSVLLISEDKKYYSWVTKSFFELNFSITAISNKEYSCFLYDKLAAYNLELSNELGNEYSYNLVFRIKRKKFPDSYETYTFNKISSQIKEAEKENIRLYLSDFTRQTTELIKVFGCSCHDLVYIRLSTKDGEYYTGPSRSIDII